MLLLMLRALLGLGQQWRKGLLLRQLPLLPSSNCFHEFLPSSCLLGLLRLPGLQLVLQVRRLLRRRQPCNLRSKILHRLQLLRQKRS